MCDNLLLLASCQEGQRQSFAAVANQAYRSMSKMLESGNLPDAPRVDALMRTRFCWQFWLTMKKDDEESHLLELTSYNGPLLECANSNRQTGRGIRFENP